MNKSFRSVWNARKQTYVAAAETVSARGKPSSGVQVAAALTALLGSLLGQGAFAQTAPPPTALPTGGQVSAGQANISQSGANMLIQQGSDRAAINWQSFNVGSNAQVQFQQPSATSVTLNRVLSSDPSQIFGRISANGQVILTNPAGVYFGKDARVDVGGLIATTHGISDADFMAGKSRYERNGSSGSVVNEGELKAHLGGYIALLAPEVRNQGAIIAQMGTVAMAAGEAVDLHFDSNNRLTSLRVEPSQIQALVENRHAVEAPGGLIILAAQSMDRLVGGVVKNSGTLQASSLTERGGRIVLEADHITLAAGSVTEVRGATGGGEVLVGGDWQGSGDMHQATTVTMEAGASIDASATDNGDGGTVVLWSDIHNPGSVTTAQGTVHARGGENGGNGGQVETSGHDINIDGFSVNTLAESDAFGNAGLWLIDPYDYVIGTTEASTISTALNTSSVTVTTSSNSTSYGSNGNSSSQGDIFLNAAINKIGSSTTSLTLEAARHIRIGTGGAISSDNSALNVQLWADTDSSGDGIIYFEGSGITTRGGSLTFGKAGQTAFLGGQSVLVGGDVFFQRGSAQTLTTGGGAVNIYGETIVANTAGLTINSGNGNVTLHGLLNSGNQYTGVNPGTAQTWLEARDAAKGGTGGGAALNDTYLATITSRLENSIAALAVSYNTAWLGARRLSDGAWQWDVGPENGQALTYTNWAPGEPNNCCTDSYNGLGYGGENAMQFTGALGQWNDLFDNGARGSADKLNYYVRETNLAPSAVTIDAGTGAVTIQGGVGTAKALKSLAVTASTTTINGNGLITTDAQTYSGSLTVNNASSTTSVTLQGTGITAREVAVYGGAIDVKANINTAAENGNILLQGRTRIASDSSIRALTSGSGNITLLTDHLVQYLGKLNITTTGVLTFAPYGSAWTNYGEALNFSGSFSGQNFMGGGDAGGLNINNLSSLGGLTLGKTGTTTGIAIDSAISIAGPIMIYGGGVTLSAGLTTTNTSTGNISIKTSDLTGGGNISLANGRVLSVDQSGISTYAGVISGTTGAFTKLGAGTLTLTGNHTYSGTTTISAGTLQVGAGGTSGTLGSGAVTNNATLRFNRSDDVTVANAISGTGALIKDSSNTLTLTANGAYTGATTISGGTLVLSNDAPARATSGFTGPGSLRIEPTASDFTSDFSTTGWVFESTLGGLTIGKASSADGSADRGVTIGSAISIAGPITLYAGALTIKEDVASTADDISLHAGSAITVDSGKAIGARNLSVSSGGTVTLGAVTTGNLTASSTGALNLGQGTVTGTLAANSGNGAITQAGALTVSGAATINAGTGAITLTAEDNDFQDAVTLTGGETQVTDKNALTVVLATTGTTTLTAGANLEVSGATVGLSTTTTGTGTTSFGATTVEGNLIVSSAGAVSQSGALDVAGTTTLTAGANNDITLDEAGNDFTGAVSVVSGKNVALADTNALDLGASTISGTLAVTTGAGATSGGVSQSGALSVTGTSTFTADKVGNQAANLSTHDNQFGDMVSFANANNGSWGSVGLKQSGNLVLGSIATGSLTAAATGAISNAAGAIVAVTNNANFSGGSITLGNQTSDSINAGSLTFNSTGAVSIAEDSATELSGSNTAGSLELNSTGAITDGVTATVKVTGNATITARDANNANQSVTLANETNDFGGTVMVTAGATSLKDATGLTAVLATTGDTTLAAGGNLVVSGAVSGAGSDLSTTTASTGTTTFGVTTVGGDLSATSAGAVSQTGKLAVIGVSTLTATGQTVTLTDATNDFVGTVTVTAGATSLKDVSGLTAVLATTGDTTLAVGGHLVVSGTVSGQGSDLTTGTTGAGTTTFGATAVGGHLSATSAGAVSQSGALDVEGTTTLTAGANDITLSNADNDFSGAVSVVSGQNVSLVDTNALILGASTISGNLSVKTGGGLTDSGALKVAGTTTLAAGANDITLSNAGNDFTGALSIVSGQNVSLVDTNALDLGASTISGNLSVKTGGALTDSGTLKVTGVTTITATGQDVTLDTADNDFGSTVTVTAGATSLKDANALTAVLATTGDATVAAGGDLAVSGTVSGAGSDLSTTTTNGGTITFGAIAVSGNLSATSAGAVSQSGALDVEGKTTLTAGANDITLDEAGNDFTGAVSVVSGQNVSLVDANALDLGASTISGDLSVKTGGALTDSGTLKVTGATTITATGQDVTLDTATNDFGGTVRVAGQDVSLVDTNALDLGASTISGTLSVKTGGALTDSGTLKVAGTTTLTSGANNDITLDQAGNDFTGAVSVVSGQNVSLVDTNALDLGASTISGDLSVKTGGALTDSGTLKVAGTTTLVVGANHITLDEEGNDFTGAVSVVSGQNVSLVDTNALDLGASTISGNLSVKTGGALTDSGALKVAGTTSLMAGANDITLDEAGNDFTGAVSVVSGQSVSLVDTNALDLGASTLSGNLSVKTGGALTDSGTLKVTGATTIMATGQDVTLDTADNDFVGTVTVTAGASSLKDVNGLTAVLATTGGTTLTAGGDLVVSGTVSGAASDLSTTTTNGGTTIFGATAVGGYLSATSAGAVSQSGALDVEGTTTLTAGANDITLSNADNDFSGAVSVVSGQNVSLVDTNALDLGASTISGDLSVKTGGALTDSGALKVTGTTSLTAGANDITLDEAGNDFTGAVSVVSGKNVAVADANALDLGASTISGNLSVKTGGALTDSGALKVAGTTSLMAGANDITLDEEGNDFTGALSVVSGQSVSLVDTNALDLGASTISGNLSVKTGGALTDSGTLKVTGATTITATGQNVTLDTADNDFVGTVTVAAGATSLKDVNGLTAVLATTGDTTVVAGGDLVVSGTVSGADSDLTLAAGGKTAFGQLTVDRNLVSTTDGAGLAGGVSQTAAIVVKGLTRFIADTGASQDALLTYASNDFQGEVSFTQESGGSWQALTLVDGVGGLTLGDVAASGKLDATAATDLALNGAVNVASLDLEATGGDISQGNVSTLTVTAGPTDLKAGTDITLDQANDFNGPVNVAEARDVVLNDTDDLLLGKVTVSGKLDATAAESLALDGTTNVGGKLAATAGTDLALNGNISAGSADLEATGGEIAQGNSSTLSVTAGPTDLKVGTDITLDQANDFTGTVNVLGGRNVMLKDIDDLVLGNVTASGKLEATAATDLALNGAVNVASLDLEATTGVITQGAAGTLSVTAGPTDLKAGEDITLDRANDFNGPVNVLGGRNVTLNDSDDLVLGKVTASGKLEATAGTDLALNGDIRAASAELEATAGVITQGADGTLTVTAGPTDLKAGTDITLDQANDFNGTVNVLGGRNVTLNDTDDLVLGNVTASGKLDATAATDIALNGAVNVASLDLEATGGDITQGTNGTLTVSTGPSNLKAGDDITLDKANDFNGTVNVLGGKNVKLNDSDDLTLGTVTTAGNLTLNSNGALSLGTTTVGGALNANSGNGDITQTGSINTVGLATFAAGSGVVTLTNLGNSFPQGTKVMAARFVIAGDAQAESRDILEQVVAAMPTSTLPGVNAFSTAAPPPLVMMSAASAAASGSSASGAEASAGGANSAGVNIDVGSAPANQAAMMAAVSLPKGTSTAGAGFSFELPESVRTLAQAGAAPQAAQTDGTPLPGWLRFNAELLRFEASAVPDGAFPLQVVLMISGQRVLVVISERTE